MNADRDEDRELRALYQGLAPAGEHPDEEAWIRFATGAITAAERVTLADHLVTCAECVAVWRAVQVLREQRAVGREELTGAAADPESQRPLWRRPAPWLAAAATVAVALSVVLLQVRSSGVPEPPSSSAPASPSAPPVASPAAPVPQAAWARDLTPPAVELPARYALVARGAESKQQFLEAFGAAIGPYRDGRYAEAASGLEAVARRFPDIPEAGFYLGVSRLLSGDARGALEPLARAREAETLGDAARWYRAAASEQAGDSVSAVAALGELCGRPGDFKARACAALEPTRRP